MNEARKLLVVNEARKLLAIARFTGVGGSSSGKPGAYRLTSGGDGLSILPIPSNIWIHRPAPGLKNVLAPSSKGIGEGDLFPARLNALKLMKGGARAEIATPEGGFFADSLEGCWLCADRELFENDEGVYRFQLIGLEIRESPEGEVVADVKDCFETGAHEILTARMRDDGREVLVPFIEEFTELRFEQGMVLIPRLHEFME